MLLLKQVFDQLDSDGLGHVAASDIKLACTRHKELQPLKEAMEDALVSGQHKFEKLLSLMYPDAKPAEFKVMLGWTAWKPIPEIMVMKIRQIFDECDTECKGKLQLGEIISILAPSSKLKEFIKIEEPDPQDVNTLVTLPQLLSLLFHDSHPDQMPQILHWGKPSRALSAKQRQDLLLLFKLYDKDGDGTLDYSELKESAATKVSERECTNLFSHFDFNSSQRITFEEFQRFFRKVLSTDMDDNMFRVLAGH